MSSPAQIKKRGILLVIGAAVAATLLKCAWAFGSSGTCDTILFFIFGQTLQHSSLAQMYASSPMFNHTPLTGLLVRALYTATGGDYLTFATVFRLLSIGADLGVVAGLLYLRRVTGRPPYWALALFALSPVSLMVSGFHGNVDPIMVLFLSGAVIALLVRRPIWCGALFAAACNIKVMPLLLGPVFAAWWWAEDRRGFGRFCVTAGGLFLAGSLWPLLQCRDLYLHKVLGYGSYFGTWGFTYWLHQTGAEAFRTVDFKGLSPLQNAVTTLLKLLTIGGVLLMAWRRRAVKGAEFINTLAAAFAVIFIFAPGAGPQYLVWFTPFLVWGSPRWYAVITGCSTAYMAAFYHPAAKWHFPWDLAFPKGWEISVWGPWMNLPWLAIILFTALQARGWLLLNSRNAVVRDRGHHQDPAAVAASAGGDIPAAA